MATENEQAQDEVVEQEENATTEKKDESSDETITLSKKDYNKMNRKAIAYDSNKGDSKPKQEEVSKENYIETVFMVKDLDQSEYESLRDEAKDLGVPFEKYLGTTSGKTMLNKLRSDKKSKDASEELTSKSPVFQKYTQADLNNMSSKEMEKILPK